MRWFFSFLVCLLLANLAFSAPQSHFLKDLTIESNEVVSGDLMIYRGNLTVKGTIDGNVAVMLGNCLISPGGHITGDLVIIQGSLELVSEEQVAGKISQKDLLATSFSSDSPFDIPKEELHDHSNDTRSYKSGDENSTVRYHDTDEDVSLFLNFNRVSGMRLGLDFTSEKLTPENSSAFDLIGFAAWAFGQNRFEYKLKLRKYLIDQPKIYIAGNIYNLSDTQDAWMLSSMENSLAGCLLQVDFFDYYDNKGFGGDIGGFLIDNFVHLNGGLFREDYAPLNRTTQWNWSWANRAYRENLYATNSEFKNSSNTIMRFGFNLEKNYKNRNKTAIGFSVKYESSLNSSSSDSLFIEYDYERLLTKFHLTYPFGRSKSESISCRVLAGTLNGESYPDQYNFRLGGPDALAGFSPKSIDLNSFDGVQGDRIDYSAPGAPNMLLAGLEYQLSGSNLDFDWIIDDLDISFMLNTGKLFAGSWDDLESDDFNLDTFHTEFGVGISNGFRGWSGSQAEDSWKLMFIRSVNSGDAKWRMLFRISKYF
jgi:hypothetical protein